MIYLSNNYLRKGLLFGSLLSIVYSLSIDAPIEEINPCLDIECREGWICKPVELPHCEINPVQGSYCDPTPVCLPAPKIGSCPVNTSMAEVEKICDSMICFQDDNCPGDKKCCNTDDCGRVCLHPGPTID